jgi:hypothetical protein
MKDTTGFISVTGFISAGDKHGTGRGYEYHSKPQDIRDLEREIEKCARQRAYARKLKARMRDRQKTPSP